MKLHRTCIDCGKLTTEGRCPPCRNIRYGKQHQSERTAWLPLIAAGRVDCWRCGELVPPDDYDLGHTPTGYRHPEHARRCNRAAAGRGEE